MVIYVINQIKQHHFDLLIICCCDKNLVTCYLLIRNAGIVIESLLIYRRFKRYVFSLSWSMFCWIWMRLASISLCLIRSSFLLLIWSAIKIPSTTSTISPTAYLKYFLGLSSSASSLQAFRKKLLIVRKRLVILPVAQNFSNANTSVSVTLA